MFQRKNTLPRIFWAAQMALKGLDPPKSGEWGKKSSSGKTWEGKYDQNNVVQSSQVTKKTKQQTTIRLL